MNCGAILIEGQWRPGRIDMDQEKVKREDYVKCEQCTTKFGKVTLYPKHALVQDDDEIFEANPGVRCPHGHLIEEKKA